MDRSTLRFWPVAIGFVFLAEALQGMGRAEDKEQQLRFKVTTMSQLTMTIGGQKNEILSDTTIGYVNKRSGREVSVRFEEVQVKASNNAVELMNTQMNADSVINVKAGKTSEVKAAEAPEEAKKMLKDCFETPICTIELEADGTETKRTISDAPGAKPLVDNGLVAGARLFHPRFSANESKWQDDREVSMGNGGYVRGKLTFEKAAESPQGQTNVKVSGELRCNEFKAPQSPVTIRNALYRVEGEQVYDHTRREWASGNLVLKVSFEMASGDTAAPDSAVGTINVVLRSLEAK